MKKNIFAVAALSLALCLCAASPLSAQSSSPFEGIWKASGEDNYFGEYLIVFKNYFIFDFDEFIPFSYSDTTIYFDYSVYSELLPCHYTLQDDALTFSASSYYDDEWSETYTKTAAGINYDNPLTGVWALQSVTGVPDDAAEEMNAAINTGMEMVIVPDLLVSDEKVNVMGTILFVEGYVDGGDFTYGDDWINIGYEEENMNYHISGSQLELTYHDDDADMTMSFLKGAMPDNKLIFPQPSYITITNPASAADYVARGDVYFENKNIDRALADYSQAIQLDQTYTEAYTKRGAAYASIREWDRALADYNFVISDYEKTKNQTDPALLGMYVSRAQAYAGLGNSQLALTEFQKVSASDPSYAPGLAAMGTFFQNNGDYDNALSYYNRAIQAAGVDAQTQEGYMSMRAMLKMNMGDIDGAIGDIEQIITSNPDASWAYIYRSQYYIMAGNVDEALNALNEAMTNITEEGADLGFLSQIISIYGMKNEPEKALELVGTYLEKYKDTPFEGLTRYFYIMAEIARKSIELGDNAVPTIADFQDIIDENTRYVEEHSDVDIYAAFGMLMCYMAVQDYEGFLGTIQSLIDKNPQNANMQLLNALTQMIMAVITISEGDFDIYNPEVWEAGIQVKDSLDKVILLDNSNYNAYRFRAMTNHIFFEKNGAALRDMEMAIALNSNNQDNWYTYGLICFENDLFEEAKKSFIQALNINSDSVDAQYGLGCSYANLGEYAQALPCFSAVISSGNTDYQLKGYKWRAQTLEALGQSALAEQDWAVLSFLNPGYEEINDRFNFQFNISFSLEDIE
jgi:tetratricopeptide (TPR) repeat protein